MVQWLGFCALTAASRIHSSSGRVGYHQAVQTVSSGCRVASVCHIRHPTDVLSNQGSLPQERITSVIFGTFEPIFPQLHLFVRQSEINTDMSSTLKRFVNIQYVEFIKHFKHIDVWINYNKFNTEDKDIEHWLDCAMNKFA